MRVFLRFKRRFSNYCRPRYYSEIKVQNLKNDLLSPIRNIGILAHIDAGKTTTTERMLYYAGTIRSMGEVHHGNTVTDFMEEERLRGITIASVAVTFPWNDCCFNLIDTPGHIDFTMEVEQTLGVIDGAVVVLDSSAGVEAQTVTVWRQADRYALPRIVYCNKMDRGDSNLPLCLHSLEAKLQVRPLAVQLPVYAGERQRQLTGIVDLVSMEAMTWRGGDQGRSYVREGLTEAAHGRLWEDAAAARRTLVDRLSDADSSLADAVIEAESMDSVDARALIGSLRRVTLSGAGVPVLCGSSYKNVGVQPLMDAVVRYLPSPLDRAHPLADSFQDDLCARAFKVIHDDQKRLLTFFRIYSGRISKGQKLYNATQHKAEQTVRLLVPYADAHEEVSEVGAGNIAVLSGLKHTASGDLVTSTPTAANAAKKRLAGGAEGDVFAFTAKVPVPVFWCSIEPPSQAYQHQLEQALVELQREDPSLLVSQSSETGQTVLAGMGELHLAIVRDRISSEYGISVDLGPMQISYREAVLSRVRDSAETQHKIGGARHSVKVELSCWHVGEDAGIGVALDRGPDSAANLAAMHPRHLQAVKHGVEAALAHGPKLNCPMVGVAVMLHWLEVGRGTSDTMVSAAVAQCLRKMFSASGTQLLEPIMQLEVATAADQLSIVLADLTRRRAAIQGIANRGDARTLTALTPLAELLGYSTDLRTITSGLASFTMEFHQYQAMGDMDEARVIKQVTGFYPT